MIPYDSAVPKKIVECVYDCSVKGDKPAVEGHACEHDYIMLDGEAAKVEEPAVKKSGYDSVCICHEAKWICC